MAKKDDNTKIILIGLAAYLLLNKGSSNNGGGNGRMFRLPNDQLVPESALPGLGYVNVQGQWYPASALNNNSGAQGSSQDWQYWVNQGLGWGAQIFDIINNMNTNSGTGGAGLPIDPNSGGNGGGGFNDPYGPDYDPFGDV